MPILDSIVSWIMKKRMHQIELFMKYPVDMQTEVFARLMSAGAETEWGKKHGFSSLHNRREFSERFPLQDYEDVKPFIDRMQKGEKNLLWPGDIRWYAKSSGTTSDKSKFIPVSQESMEECHFKAGKDMLSLYCNNVEDTQLFTGKNLALGGSHKQFTGPWGEYNTGDLSAIIIQNLPLLAEVKRTPSLEIALMDEWETKIDKMAEATIPQNVTSMAGVPSWLLLLSKHILERTGKKDLQEVWPNLEVFFHGGISFDPYREQFIRLIGNSNFRFMETYNASEGFFGLQDDLSRRDMLLMLDYGIYYEFIPAEKAHDKNAASILLEDVELNTNYAMVISTNGGLWRYLIGDTVEFTSLFPHRIKISGRTKNFINAFGEELIVDNAEKALKIACEKTGSVLCEYTAGPVYLSDNSSGAHEWIIEFEKLPDDMDYFTEVFDNALKSVNSDYEAKRYRDMILKTPLIRVVNRGTFFAWLKSKNKLGGQNKVPRLSNNRKILEEILELKP